MVDVLAEHWGHCGLSSRQEIITGISRDYPQGNYQITPGYTPNNCLDIQQIIQMH
jgi:hypothetical protein